MIPNAYLCCISFLYLAKLFCVFKGYEASYNVNISSIQFLGLTNMGIATKITALSAIEVKIWTNLI